MWLLQGFEPCRTGTAEYEKSLTIAGYAVCGFPDFSGEARDELREGCRDGQELHTGQVDDGAVGPRGLAHVAHPDVEAHPLAVVLEGHGVDRVGQDWNRVFEERAVLIEVAYAGLLVEFERAPQGADDFEPYGGTAISDPTHVSAPAQPQARLA